MEEGNMTACKYNQLITDRITTVSMYYAYYFRDFSL